MSVAATRIVQAALKADVGIAELSGFARADPGFALRVLAFVNSPLMGFTKRIDDVRQACTMLGIRGLRTIALGLIVTGLTPTSARARHLLGNCLRRAIVARELAKAKGGMDADASFTNGLFLDMGLLLTANQDPDLAADIGSSPAIWRVTRERASGLLTHPERGAQTAAEYGLPDTLVEALLHHHDLEPPFEAAAAIAWLAERCAGIFEGGDPLHHQKQVIEAARQVGFPLEKLEAILPQIPAKVAELAKVFDRDIGPQLDVDSLRGQAQTELASLNAQYESLVRAMEVIIAKKDTLEVELRAANVRLERLASVDELTGLLNRRALEEAMRRDLARADRDGTSFSILLLDIDHFKSVNDNWGHQAGDAVLSTVGDVIRVNLRASDVGGRYGGEEFLCILPATDEAGAKVVAERMRAGMLERTTPIAGGFIQVSVSIGIATVRGPGCRTAFESVVRSADERLYRAKAEGRNRVVP